MKKQLLSLTLAALMLTGCAGKGSSSVQPTTNEDGKENIKVACVCSFQDSDVSYTKQKISEFNRSSDSYEAELVVYTEEEGQSAMSKLSEDLADGKTPDVIITSPSKLRKLYDRGYLADLGEVMDECDGIKKDEIVPSLLNAISIDGHIPAIPFYIYADTICVDTERLGKDIINWNFEQAISFYNSLSEDEKANLLRFSYTQGKETVANYFIDGAIISSMDYRSYTFDPENGLRQALEFIYSLPDDTNAYKSAELTPAIPILTSPNVSVSCFYSQEAVGAHQGKDISLVGYPTETGRGVQVHAYEGLGIMENSPCKQGAWDYINNVAIEPYDPFAVPSGGLPLRASLYPHYYDIDPITSSSINAGYTEDGWGAVNPEDVKYRITDAQKQQLKEYIADLDICIYRDEELENIIREECNYVVSGERTPDQCIDILNDRIGTYLAENK